MDDSKPSSEWKGYHFLSIHQLMQEHEAMERERERVEAEAARAREDEPKLPGFT